MKIFLNVITILIIIYNLHNRSKNIYKAIIPAVAIISNIALFVIAILLWFIFDKTLQGLLIAINATLSFLSVLLSAGIGEDKINFKYSTLPLIQVEYIDKLKNIKIKN